MKKKRTISILGGLSLFASAVAYVGHYFYAKAVAVNRKDFIQIEEEYNMQDIFPDDPWAEEKKWYQEVTHESMTIHSSDQLRLSSLFIPAEKDVKKVAIIAHGYNGSNRDMAPWAKLFYDLGFHLLIPDARGHGESEGNYIGFGWHERKDYLIWINKIIDRFGPDTEIILYGLSMGGATVMNVSGETLPSNVKAIIEDCGYSSVTKELAHQMKRLYKLPQYPLLPLVSFVTKMRAGYWFKEANPQRQVKNSQTPILFIHGEADDFVPTHMVYDVYEAATCPKDLYIVPEASHAYSYVQNKEEYRRRIKQFLDNYIDL
jgi:hypothetical protein